MTILVSTAGGRVDRMSALPVGAVELMRSQLLVRSKKSFRDIGELSLDFNLAFLGFIVLRLQDLRRFRTSLRHR